MAKKEKEQVDLFVALTEAVQKLNQGGIDNVIKAIFKRIQDQDDAAEFLKASFLSPLQGAYIWNKTISEKPKVFMFVIKCITSYAKGALPQALEAVLLTEDPYRVMPIQTVLLTSADVADAVTKAVKGIKDKAARETLINEMKNRKNSEDISTLDMKDSWDNKAGKVFSALG
jgi:hypothetical protein